MFPVNYTGMGAVAAIKIEGFLIYEGESGIAQKWLKDKKLPDNVANELLNLIMRNCVMEGVVLARDMRLPPAGPAAPGEDRRTETAAVFGNGVRLNDAPMRCSGSVGLLPHHGRRSCF